MQQEYMDKAVAAKYLGLSARRVLELAAKGKIQSRVTLSRHNRKQVVLLAASVRNYKEHRFDRPVVIDGSVEAEGGMLLLEAKSSTSHDLPPYAYLTIDEAASMLRLPGSVVLKLVTDEKIPARDVGVRPGGRYRIQRRVIEAFTD